MPILEFNSTTIKQECICGGIHVIPLMQGCSKSKKEPYALAEGDAIEVKGSRGKMDGSDAILAREIKKGSQTLKLRDEKGIPLWSHSRQH